MNIETYKTKEVGQIVADNFAAAEVFSRFNIDFCCHGNVSLSEACAHSGVEIEQVVEALEHQHSAQHIEFSEWPLDLLIDYVLKIHHRGAREKGPQLLTLLDKVIGVHGANHPELNELRNLLEASLNDLGEHFLKEENVLFPYLYQMCEADLQGQKLEPMHCGSVANPIRVMRMEHEGEGNRYHYITRLTDNFTPPADACNSYRLMLEQLKAFMNALFEHIHLENNLIFPRAEELERRCVSENV